MRYFAIKAAIADPDAAAFTFTAQKTMYGGKRIAAGDTVFLFASGLDARSGLIARGRVTAAEAVARRPDVARQTPRVTLAIERTARATRPPARPELKRFTRWRDGRPETELNFKFYRQAADKVVGLSDEAAAFLETFFGRPPGASCGKSEPFVLSLSKHCSSFRRPKKNSPSTSSGQTG